MDTVNKALLFSLYFWCIQKENNMGTVNKALLFSLHMYHCLQCLVDSMDQSMKYKGLSKQRL